jgi:hypothetical protein
VVKEKSYFASNDRRCRVANPAEVLICRNAGIRKDLGASSRSSGLPQRTGLESNLFSQVPRREESLAFCTNGKGTSLLVPLRCGNDEGFSP